MAKQVILNIDTTDTRVWPSRETKGAFHNRGSLFTRTDPKLYELNSRLRDGSNSSAQINDSRHHVPHPPNQPNSASVAQQPRLQSAKGRLESQFKPLNLLKQRQVVVEMHPDAEAYPRSASARVGNNGFFDPRKLLKTFHQEHLKKFRKLKKELTEERRHQEMSAREKKWNIPGSAKARTFDDYMPQEKKPKEKASESEEIKNLTGSLMISHIHREPTEKPSASEGERTLSIMVIESPSHKVPLPETLEPLRPWLTKEVPQAMTGISTDDCLVFLPSLLLLEDWTDLPELPPEISSDDYLPCSEIILPSPPTKKYEHPFNERKLPKTNWTCNHGGAFGQAGGESRSKMTFIPRMPPRNMGMEREEIVELERLMQGVGSLDSGCEICKYQAEISLLRQMSEQTLARAPKLLPQPDADPDSPEEDTFGLVEACRSHGEAMQQMQKQHQQCVTALSHLESDLDIPQHRRGFSHDPGTMFDDMDSSHQRLPATPTQPHLDKEGLFCTDDDELKSSAESQSDVELLSELTPSVKSVDTEGLSLHHERSGNQADVSRGEDWTTDEGSMSETSGWFDVTPTTSESRLQELHPEA